MLYLLMLRLCRFSSLSHPLDQVTPSPISACLLAVYEYTQRGMVSIFTLLDSHLQLVVAFRASVIGRIQKQETHRQAIQILQKAEQQIWIVPVPTPVLERGREPFSVRQPIEPAQQFLDLGRVLRVFVIRRDNGM